MNSDTQDKCSIFNRRVSLIHLITVSLLCFWGGISPLLSAADVTEIPRVSVKSLADIVLLSEQSVMANVISLNQPVLRAQVTAMVKEIHVEIGQSVSKGERLLSLDCRDYHYTLQQINATHTAKQAQLHLLQKNYQRNKKLLQQASIPQQRFDQSKADYLSAQAEINALQAQASQAKLTIERCQINAPFAGEIIQRQVQNGQLVDSNSALFTLLQTNNLRINAELSNSLVNDIKQADSIIFQYQQQQTAVKLAKIIAFIDEKNRNQTVHFKLIDHTQLITGMVGRIVWSSPLKKLPAQYLSKRQGKLGVLLLKSEGSIQRVHFKVLSHAQEGRATLINLPSESIVIDQGRLHVHDQQIVTLK